MKTFPRFPERFFETGTDRTGTRTDRVTTLVRDNSGNGSYEERDAVRVYARQLRRRYMESPFVYSSDVCVPDDDDGVARLLHEFETGPARSDTETHARFHIVSIHGSHVHVAHASPMSNGACRCAWITRSPTWRRTRKPGHRRRVYVSDLEIQDWQNIIRYFGAEGYATKHSEGGGVDGRQRLRVENLPVNLN